MAICIGPFCFSGTTVSAFILIILRILYSFFSPKSNKQETKKSLCFHPSAVNRRVVLIDSIVQWEKIFTIANKRNRYVMVDFTASWCGPCKKIAPIYDRIAKEYSNCYFLKVDVDEMKSLASKYNITAMPSFVIFYDGKIVDQVRGANEKAIISMLHKALK